MRNNKWQDTIIVLIATMIALFLFFKNILLLYVALGLCFTVVVFPFLGKLIHRLWFLLAKFMGMTFGKVILTFIYLIFVLPLAWIFRSKLSIDLKLRADTYFKNRNHRFDKTDMENPW